MTTLDTLSTYADDAKQQVSKAAQQAGDSVRSGYLQTRQAVRQQPVEAVLMCFAAGMIGGFCIAMALRGMRA